MNGIIMGIFQSLFAALGMSLGKKVVENKKIGNNWQTFFSRFNHGLIIIILIYFGVFGFEFNLEKEIITSSNIIILVSAVIGLYITYPLRRIAYANEKMSTLQPFAMLNQVFPLIIGFIFIASERANIITFIMALIASIVVIGASIDKDKLKLNKYSTMVLISSIIKSIQVFAVIYFISIMSPETFYFIESVLVISISILLITFKNEFSEIKMISKKYFRLLMTANLVAVCSILLAMNMYTSLGIIATSLLSLLYLVFVYIFGYFLLGEKPSKKDLLITLIIVICIIVGTAFRTTT